MRPDPRTIEDAAETAYVTHLNWRIEDGWGYPPKWDKELPSVKDHWRRIAAAVLTNTMEQPTYAEDAGQ